MAAGLIGTSHQSPSPIPRHTPDRFAAKVGEKSGAKRVGLFGGTFAPPHLAHLIIAQEAIQRMALDKVLFLPALVPPHKRGIPISAFGIRMRMVQAAIEKNASFEISDIESRLPSPSYTIDTLMVLTKRHPDWGSIFLILGSDSLLDLGSWKNPDAILGLATVVVYPRAGFPVEDARRTLLDQVELLDVREIPMSSTYLRGRVRRGLGLRYWVPDRVADMIKEAGLYLDTDQSEVKTEQASFGSQPSSPLC